MVRRFVKRFGVAVSIALMSLLMFSQGAFAGEWNPKGDVAAKVHGGSACLFNGLDQPDETAPGAGDGEPIWYDLNGNEKVDPDEIFADDESWGSTPAGGKVQSYGQIVASGGKDFAPSPGVACNPTSGFEE
jgi:hypothetical protein